MEKVLVTIECEENIFANEKITFNSIKESFEFLGEKMSGYEFLNTESLYLKRCNDRYYNFLKNLDPENMEFLNSNEEKEAYKNIQFDSYENVTKEIKVEEIIEGIYYTEAIYYNGLTENVDEFLEISIGEFLLTKKFETEIILYNSNYSEQYDAKIILEIIN